jgi:hypothetical protein
MSSNLTKKLFVSKSALKGVAILDGRLTTKSDQNTSFKSAQK